jgi:hypothetical protein
MKLTNRLRLGKCLGPKELSLIYFCDFLQPLHKTPEQELAPNQVSTNHFNEITHSLSIYHPVKAIYKLILLSFISPKTNIEDCAIEFSLVCDNNMKKPGILSLSPRSFIATKASF